MTRLGNNNRTDLVTKVILKWSYLPYRQIRRISNGSIHNFQKLNNTFQIKIQFPCLRGRLSTNLTLFFYQMSLEGDS